MGYSFLLDWSLHAEYFFCLTLQTQKQLSSARYANFVGCITENFFWHSKPTKAFLTPGGGGGGGGRVVRMLTSTNGVNKRQWTIPTTLTKSFTPHHRGMAVGPDPWGSHPPALNVPSFLYPFRFLVWILSLLYKQRSGSLKLQIQSLTVNRGNILQRISPENVHK